MRKLWRALLILGAFGAAADAGMADSVRGCFVRVYDRAHLARHPDQVVTAVKLLVKQAERGSQYDFFLHIKVRGRNEVLKTAGLCQTGGPRVHCFVECDGGGIDVNPRPGYVMMYLDRIRMAECGKDNVEDGEEISGGKDDREFRLDRVDEVMCAGE
jgi:hypothetical protein